MTANVLNITGELIGIVVGAVVLWLFAITFSPIVRRPTILPGQAGPRTTRGADVAHDIEGQEKGGEVVRADGYIDSFAGVVEESGGGLPLIVTITAIAIPLWWLLYIVINWSQYLLSVRTFK